MSLSFETRQRTSILPIFRGIGIDAMPAIGATVGNALTFGGLSFTLRLGHDLPNDFGPPQIRPSLPASEYVEKSDKFNFYLFAGFGTRFVARNIFLDGNTFANSHSVPRRRLVADFQYGFVMSLWGKARLSFTNIRRSKEFKGGKGGGDEFGAISLSFRL